MNLGAMEDQLGVTCLERPQSFHGALPFLGNQPLNSCSIFE